MTVFTGSKRSVAATVSLIIVASVSLTSMACLNVGGSRYHGVHADCHSCAQDAQGNWYKAFLASFHGPCSGTKYSDTVSLDRHCGYAPQLAITPEGQPIRANVTYQYVQGECNYGDCDILQASSDFGPEWMGLNSEVLCPPGY